MNSLQGAFCRGNCHLTVIPAKSTSPDRTSMDYTGLRSGTTAQGRIQIFFIFAFTQRVTCNEQHKEQGFLSEPLAGMKRKHGRVK